MSDLSLEDVLIYEALDYKEVSGASGEQLNIKACPNCGKEKWKVYANKDSGAGKCFSCDQNFNVWTFVRWLLKEKGGTGENRDVGRYLADARQKLGYRPKGHVAPKIRIATVEGDFELPQSMAIPDARGGNHPYLEGRGIDAETAGEFGLRFSLFGWHGYKNDKGEDVKQSFANRILFPVWNLDGTMVTFQGRDVTGTSENKYKFAGGLPGTGRYLYNGHTARGLRAKHVVMNEGPTDVIKTRIAIRQASDLADIVPVGSFGMNLTSMPKGDDQIGAFNRLRKEGLEKVTVMWDPEPKAFIKALDACEMLIKTGLQAQIATLPAGADPGDADAAVIHRAIREAVPITRTAVLRMRMKNPYQHR